MAIKNCKWCGTEITKDNQAIKNMKWGIHIRNECKPCRSKQNVIYKQKSLEEKSVPCQHCGLPCIKNGSKAFCSTKCTLLGTIKEKDGCWIWQGHKRFGYGKLHINGKETMAHRVSYGLFKEPIAEGKIILHSCHNPSCINPDHLSQGTVQDNSNDMIAASRSLVGSKHPNSKLTEKDVNEIKVLILEEGVTIAYLASRFGVTSRCIENIFTGRTWNHDF